VKCVICDRETDGKSYCELHEKAYESIVEEYDVWKEALKISWRGYLSEIAKNPFTGEWAKEVAEYLVTSGEK